MRLALIATLIGVVAASAFPCTATYSGCLSSKAGCLEASGAWKYYGTTLSWEVWSPDNPYNPSPGNWTYNYYLDVGKKGDISHFILEVSPTFTEDNVVYWCDDGDKLEGPQWYDSSNGNPLMPEAIWGVKWDEVDTKQGTFVLVTDRQPMWGDFYAKDGTAGIWGINTVWNSGLRLEDPSAPVENGSIYCHILVPDTQGGGGNPPPPAVPEPLTLAGVLGGMGLLGGYIRKRRRSKKA